MDTGTSGGGDASNPGGGTADTEADEGSETDGGGERSIEDTLAETNQARNRARDAFCNCYGGGGECNPPEWMDLDDERNLNQCQMDVARQYRDYVLSGFDCTTREYDRLEACLSSCPDDPGTTCRNNRNDCTPAPGFSEQEQQEFSQALAQCQ